MARLGKKILSAFVELSDDKPSAGRPEDKQTSSTPAPAPAPSHTAPPPPDNGKFRQYFDKLFADANIPGPDYFEFSKMTEAMASIGDEKTRYGAAFAGLQVQGLDKSKLLSTAQEYLRVLETDAGNFQSTVDAAIQEKVKGRRQEMEDKEQRIQQLTKEIDELQQQIARLRTEVQENEQKIEQSAGGYRTAMENMKQR
ncbi:MAG: hypothetical protein JST39_04005, partial [Bacteroidetes bacterium]|nr:hypothetical protein [Bacteroidota bacterium]